MLRRLVCSFAALAALTAVSPAAAAPKASKLDPATIVLPDVRGIGTEAPSGTIRLWAGQLYIEGARVATEYTYRLYIGPDQSYIGLDPTGVYEIVYPLANARGKDLKLTCKGEFKPIISVKTLGYSKSGAWDEEFSNTTEFPTTADTFEILVPAHKTKSDAVSIEMRSYNPMSKRWRIDECVIEQTKPITAKKASKPTTKHKLGKSR